MVLGDNHPEKSQPEKNENELIRLLKQLVELNRTNQNNIKALKFVEEMIPELNSFAEFEIVQ
jgi:hypothetical protein